MHSNIDRERQQEARTAEAEQDADAVAARRAEVRAVDLATEELLVDHQRMENGGGCLCGWVQIGHTYSGHLSAVLRAAGVLR